MSHSQTRRGFTLIESLVILLLVMILSSLLSPAIHQAQRDARSITCKNNLKQLGLALHNYYDAFKTLPPGWVAHHWEAGNGPGYGWQSFLLPSIDQAPLYDQLNFDRMKLNTPTLKTAIKVYRCPADPTPELNPLRSKLGTSNYSGNFGEVPAPRLGFGRRSQHWAGGQAATPERTSGLFFANSSVRFRDVTDGLSNTLMASERSSKSGAGIWAGTGDNTFESDAVTDCSIWNPPNQSPNSFSSHHKQGLFILLGDGAVRFVSDKINSGSPQRMGTWQLLSHRSDNQVVGEY